MFGRSLCFSRGGVSLVFGGNFRPDFLFNLRTQRLLVCLDTGVKNILGTTFFGENEDRCHNQTKDEQNAANNNELEEELVERYLKEDKEDINTTKERISNNCAIAKIAIAILSARQAR